MAPPVLREDEEKLHFNNGVVLYYYLDDYRANIPRISKLLGDRGKYSHRLTVSYYVNAPNTGKIAYSARTASTNKEALWHTATRLGAKPSAKLEKEIASAESARRGAETEEDIPRFISVYVALVCSPDEIDNDKNEFESLMQSLGIIYIPSKWISIETWRTIVPLCQLRLSKTYEPRNVFARNVGGMNPVTAQTYFEEAGDFCGFSPVSANHYMPVAVVRGRGEKLPTSDAIVGAQNSGKSFSMKMKAVDWLVQGHNVFIVDPGMEFAPLADTFGGKRISIMGRRGFNLFRFDPIEKNISADLRDNLADMVFNDNLAALLSLYKMVKGGNASVTGTERNHLTNALKQVMRQNNMDPSDPSTWTQAITLGDVYQVLLREMSVQDPDNVRVITATLEQYGDKDGQYYEIFNTETTFDLDSDLIVAQLGLSQFGADPVIKALASHYALRMASQHAIRTFLTQEHETPRPYHIIIDEASQLFVSAQVVTSVTAMLSMFSKFEIALHLAVQDFKALQRAEEMSSVGDLSSTNTLMSVIQAYWFFHQQPQSAHEAANVFSLSQGEQDMIVHSTPGQCLLVMPAINVNLPLRIVAPDELVELFRTDAAVTRDRIIESMS